jgi:hypothetical protein
LVTAVGCGSPEVLRKGSDGDLSETECRQLLERIEQISAANMTPEEQEEWRQTPEEIEEFVSDCVAGEIWNREGYECVMEATTEEEIDQCARKAHLGF